MCLCATAEGTGAGGPFAVGLLEHTPRGQVCRTFGSCRLISSIFDKRGIHQFVYAIFLCSGAEQQLPIWLKSCPVRADIIASNAQPKKKSRRRDVREEFRCSGGPPPWHKPQQPPAHTEEDDYVTHGSSGGSGDSWPPSRPPPLHLFLPWYKDDVDTPVFDKDLEDEDEYEAVQNMPLPTQGAWQCHLCANLNLRSYMMCSVCAQVRAKEEDATDCNASASLNLQS